MGRCDPGVAGEDRQAQGRPLCFETSWRTELACSCWSDSPPAAWPLHGPLDLFKKCNEHKATTKQARIVRTASTSAPRVLSLRSHAPPNNAPLQFCVVSFVPLQLPGFVCLGPSDPDTAVGKVRSCTAFGFRDTCCPLRSSSHPRVQAGGSGGAHRAPGSGCWSMESLRSPRRPGTGRLGGGLLAQRWWAVLLQWALSRHHPDR